MLKLRQPPALQGLLFCQALERVGSVLILILVPLFLTHVYQLDDVEALGLVGAYGALSMASYLVGGLLSDRLMSYRSCILTGAFMLACSFLLLTLPDIQFVYAGLTAASIGGGLFLPNLSGFVSEFYYERDPRRNSGFIWLYMSMNIGALFAATLAALFLPFYGWHFTFYICSITSLASGFIFLLNKGHFEGRGQTPGQLWLNNKTQQALLSIGTLIALTALIFYLLQHITLSNVLLCIFTIIILSVMLIISFFQSEEQRYRLIRLIALIAFSTIFWGLCSQEYMTVLLFIDRAADLHQNEMGISAPTYLALNALLVAVFCPILAQTWKKLQRVHKEPTPGVKIALSLLSLGVAMTLLTVSNLYPNPDQHVNVGIVFSAFIFMALGESLLYPTGLSLATLLAPPRWRSLFAGLWFVSIGMGYLIASQLAKLAELPHKLLPLSVIEHSYAHAFGTYAALAFAASAALFLLLPVLKRFFPVHLQGTSEH